MFGKKSLSEFLRELKLEDSYKDRIVYWHTIEGREAKTVSLPDDIDGRLAGALEKRGISSLYTHQRTAYEKVRSGKSIVAVTPTASGKTLCYNLPVLQSVIENPLTRALYIFPTKALAQDQKAKSMN